jgi:hypothetical protein
MLLLYARVLSDRYSYAVAMSTLGAFNLAAAVVFLACPGASKETRAALLEASLSHQAGKSAALHEADSCGSAAAWGAEHSHKGLP